MATTSYIRRAALVAAALAAAVSGASFVAGTATAESGAPTQLHSCAAGRTLLSSTAESTTHQLTVDRARAPRVARAAGYDWPLRPFDRQHPIRAFFNDPRIGDHGGEAFHFGIDIAAPDGTAVYAVEAGKVFFDNPRAIAVEAGDRSHEFGYWHIVPIVKSHQLVRRHQLIGYIDRGWGHVHFAERRNGKYLNPLRPGALGPYVDRTPPSIDEVSVVRSDGGSVDLVASAYDMPDPQVPGAWAGEPVTPALLQWRLERDGAHPGEWRTAVDFRGVMLPASTFQRVYAPATRQNHKGEPGLFCFYLTHGWNTAGLAAGSYRLQVSAVDTQGNRVLAEARLTVSNGSIEP
jgi:Peptidase family M23